MATINTPGTQSPAPQRLQSPTTNSASGTPSSSVRPSLDVPRIGVRPTSPVPPNASQRRNRAALRDYYNLKSKAAAGQSLTRTASLASVTNNGTAASLTAFEDSSLSSTLRSQLDEANFDAENYVQELLKSSNLKTVLKAEASLVSEIKNLDGERKALVYDNYSKLIAATQTIVAMRSSMDEDGGESLRSISMLGPAVDAVAKSAADLSQGREESNITRKREQRASMMEGRSRRETVRWVLGTPARLRESLQMEQREEAESDWKDVQELLAKWIGVQGSAELKAACEKIMSQTLPDRSTAG